MNKGEFRRILRNMGLPEAQARVAHRANAGAFGFEELEVARAPSGTLVISRTRYWSDSRQAFEYTIDPDGGTQVVQRTYDATGNLACDGSQRRTP